MATHNETGKTGEDLAAAYLEKNGFRILDRNWRHGKGEVDIICTREGFIVFVEVKTRSTDFFGNPEEAVDKKKKSFLVKAADNYVNLHDIPLEVRFDIVSILINGSRHTVRHIEDAFYPTL